MAEREYYDLEDYLASGGDPSYGQAVSTSTPTGTGQATPKSGPPYTMSNLPPPAAPGFQWVLNESTGEFEYIAQGDSTSNVTSGTPSTTPQTATTTSTTPVQYPTANDYTGGSSYNYTPNWPTYNAPGYLDPGPFDPGDPFSFEDFTYQDFSAPTAETMLNEPGFQFRMDQGRKALEASAAGRGTLRSGGTLKDILQYGQNFASQEYGNVYNRALQEYDTNRNNAFGNYSSRRQNAWDTWNTGYMGRKDAYGFQADNYGRQNTFNQNNAQFDFTGRQQQVQAELDDAFRRWSQEGSWLTNLGGD